MLDLEWDRIAGWWRAEFTGHERRVYLGNRRGKSIPLENNKDEPAEGPHVFQGTFCETGIVLPAEATLALGI